MPKKQSKVAKATKARKDHLTDSQKEKSATRRAYKASKQRRKEEAAAKKKKMKEEEEDRQAAENHAERVFWEIYRYTIDECFQIKADIMESIKASTQSEERKTELKKFIHFAISQRRKGVEQIGRGVPTTNRDNEMREEQIGRPRNLRSLSTDSNELSGIATTVNNILKAHTEYEAGIKSLESKLYPKDEPYKHIGCCKVQT